MPTVHISSATHGQEAGDRGRVDDYIYRNFAFVGRIQQIPKDIHVCENVHDHGYYLKQTHRELQMVGAFPGVCEINQFSQHIKFWEEVSLMQKGECESF